MKDYHGLHDDYMVDLCCPSTPSFDPPAYLPPGGWSPSCGNCGVTCQSDPGAHFFSQPAKWVPALNGGGLMT